jgi:O-acetyl-ADP-ribose deacetylase (regulator of RNase III)
MIRKGNLITLAQKGEFDVIAHGCNCFCVMGAGIAPQMAKAFGCDEYSLEQTERTNQYGDKIPTNNMGNINKLGQIEYQRVVLKKEDSLTKGYVDVVNCYTQFGFGKNHIGGADAPLDYEALKLCMRKINYIFSGQHIGLPWIGCGLAGGSKDRVSIIIEDELKDCKVTIVEYDKS